MIQNEPSGRFTFADGLALVFGLLVVLPFAGNPNNDVPERLVALGAGLLAMGLAWAVVRRRRMMIRIVVVPSVTLAVMLLVAMIWKAAT